MDDLLHVEDDLELLSGQKSDGDRACDQTVCHVSLQEMYSNLESRCPSLFGSGSFITSHQPWLFDHRVCSELGLRSAAESRSQPLLCTR